MKTKNKINGRFIKQDQVERFWEKVNKLSDDECWEWQGGIKETGRGLCWYNSKVTTAHRASWQIHFGSTEGLNVLHKCDNGKCVNPYHLFLGTLSDNSRDMVKKGRHVGNTRFNKEIAARIKNDYSFRKVTIKMIAQKYNMAYTTAFKIIHNKVKYAR